MNDENKNERDYYCFVCNTRCGVVAAVGCFLVKHFVKNNILDGDGMVNDRCLSCTYHLGGGMDGNSLRITVKETNN